MANISLEQFESIGDVYAKQLASIGIRSIADFNRRSVAEIEAGTGIKRKRIMQWRDVLDLYRIPGISHRDAELLYHVNINSVEELSHRQAVRIYYALKELDENTHVIIIDLPTFRTIDEWVYYAKLLTKRIKAGLNIPVIKMPLVTVDVAFELQKFQVVTVDELLIKDRLIKNLFKKVGMSKKAWRELMDFISLLAIDGIDVYFAGVLTKAGFVSPLLLKNAEIADFFTRINLVEKSMDEVMEPITLEMVTRWKEGA
ncbi:MAG: DUF4332 domain-containing protein [Promethearchaeota archaeon]